MDQLTRPAYELFASPKRLRVLLGGQFIVDTRRAVLLRRDDAPPVYYFPLDDLQQGSLEQSGRRERQAGYGEAQFYNVRSNGCERTDAA